MSDQPHHLVFLISDNRGEQDYIQSIARSVKARAADSNGSLHYSVYRQVPNGQGYDLYQLADLPANASELQALSVDAPRLAPETVAQHVAAQDGMCRIIAGGFKTLDQATTLQHAIALATHQLADISYITHKVDEKDRAALFDYWVRFITPQPQQDIADQFAIDAAKITTRYTALDEVPHSYTLDECLAHLQTFNTIALDEPDSFAAQLMACFDRGEKIALTVLPAGFDKLDPDQPDRHMPYTEDEALHVGYAIGQHLNKGTTMVVIDGGPRNRKDQAVGEDTQTAFINGYVAGQQELQDGGHFNNILADTPHPRLLSERFENNMPYDTTKVAVALAYLYPEQFAALYVSGEGNAMRSAVLHHIEPGTIETGMIVSDVLHQRGDNLAKDQQAGLPIIALNPAGGLTFDRAAEPLVLRNQSPAQAVLTALNI